jgi:hypothetical protein
VRVIYKYTLPAVAGNHTVALPLGAEVLCVKVQGNDPVLYAKVCPGECAKEDVRTVAVCTGLHIPDNLEYIGTSMHGVGFGHAIAQGAHVLHWFISRRYLPRPRV